MRFIMLAAAAALFVVPAQAQTASPDKAPATVKSGSDKPVKEKRICRPKQNSTSRMGGLVCHTQAEWSALSQQDNNDIDRVRRQ